MKQSATVILPATTANLGPGYDCLGLALNLTNQVTFTRRDSGLVIEVYGEGKDSIPVNESNLVYRSACRLFDKFESRPSGLHIRLRNQIPVSSGLGSSAAATLGGILAANQLMGEPLDDEEVLTLAIEIEGHPDNIIPAYYGGLALSLFDGEELVVELIPLPSIKVVVVLPQFSLSTSEARAVLPDHVPRSDAIFNISRTSLLVRALALGELGKLRIAMQDRLHQPYRLSLIPGMQSAFTEAIRSGAAGVALSGAGPAVIAFATEDHQTIENVLKKEFEAAGLKSRSWVLSIFQKTASY